VTIPNSVTTIKDYAFFQNKLKEVRIPDSVTTIGDEAFSEQFSNSVTMIGDSFDATVTIIKT
jgi:hypothetical protein